MIDGNATCEIFSDEFNSIRACNHNVTIDNYLNHMKDLYNALDKLDTYSEVCLWFGNDTFCQINLLTLLAYFDKNSYKGNIKIKLINDANYQVLDEYDIKDDNYYEKYCQLLVNHKTVSFVDNSLNNAVTMYLDLVSDDGDIAATIKKNKNLSRRELVELVWNKTRSYGLGDVQVFKLVDKYYNR